MGSQRNISLLKWFEFFTDFKLYSPIAAIYFARVTDSFALGMAVFSIVQVSSALFEVPTGVFSDYIGRRKTLILGAAASVLFTIFYAIGFNFWFLAIGAAIEGLSRSFYSGNNHALLHDTLTEDNKQDRFHAFLGKMSAYSQIALAIAAVLGGLLAEWSFALILWISVITQLVCLGISLFIVEPKVHSKESSNIFNHLKESIHEFMHNKKLRLVSLSSILGHGFGEAGYQYQALFYNTLWPIWGIGLARFLSYAGAAASFHYSGRLIDKFGEAKIMMVGRVYARVVNTLSVAFPTMASPLIMQTPSAFFGVVIVSESNLMQKEFTQHQRATMGSLTSFAGSLCYAAVAFLLGFLADRIGVMQALLAVNIVQFSYIYLNFQLLRFKK